MPDDAQLTHRNPRKNMRKLLKESLGIGLRKGYVIHHIDHNPGNNDLGNLARLTYSEHVFYHRNYKNTHPHLQEPIPFRKWLKNLRKHYGR